MDQRTPSATEGGHRPDDTPDSTAGVPELRSRIEIGSRSLTSALGCLKVSKNSSSMDESTAMFAAGGGPGDDFRGSSPTSQAEAWAGENCSTSGKQDAFAASLDQSHRILLP